jgi:hypothetical protein
VPDGRSVEAAVAGADGVVNTVRLYVEHGSETFRPVHVNVAAAIVHILRQSETPAPEGILRQSETPAPEGKRNPHQRGPGSSASYE